MYTILDNLRLTRKHRVTHIENGDGKLIWSCKSTGEAIAWLIEAEHEEARLRVGEKYIELSFKPWPI